MNFYLLICISYVIALGLLEEYCQYCINEFDSVFQR